MASPSFMQIKERLENNPQTSQDQQFDADLLSEVEQNIPIEEVDLFIDEILPLVSREETKFKLISSFMKKHLSDPFLYFAQRNKFIETWINARESSKNNISFEEIIGVVKQQRKIPDRIHFLQLWMDLKLISSAPFVLSKDEITQIIDLSCDPNDLFHNVLPFEQLFGRYFEQKDDENNIKTFIEAISLDKYRELKKKFMGRLKRERILSGAKLEIWLRLEKENIDAARVDGRLNWTDQHYQRLYRDLEDMIPRNSKVSEYINLFCDALFHDNQEDMLNLFSCYLLDTTIDDTEKKPVLSDFSKRLWNNAPSLSEREAVISSLQLIENEDFRAKIAEILLEELPFDDPSEATALCIKMAESVPGVAVIVHSFYVNKMKSLNRPLSSDYLEEYHIKPITEYCKREFTDFTRDLENIARALAQIPTDIKNQIIVDVCLRLFDKDEKSRVTLFSYYLHYQIPRQTSLFSEPYFSNIVSLFKTLKNEHAQIQLIESVLMWNTTEIDIPKLLEIVELSDGKFFDSIKVLFKPQVSAEEMKTHVFSNDTLERNLRWEMTEVIPSLQKEVCFQAAKLFIANNPNYTVDDFDKINIDMIKLAVIFGQASEMSKADDQEVDRLLDQVLTIKDHRYRASVFPLMMETIQQSPSITRSVFFAKAFSKFKGNDHQNIREILLNKFKPTQDTASDYLRYLSDHLSHSDDFQRYDTSYVMRYFLDLPVESGIENLSSFVRGIYPNAEILQIELFVKILEMLRTSDEVKISVLKKFSKDIKDDALCLDLLRQAVSGDLQIPTFSPMDILEIASNRTPANYQSLQGVLNSHTLGEAISKEHFDRLNDEFKGKLKPEMPLTGIFTYFDLIRDPGRLVSILTNKVKSDIKNNYRCPEHPAFITSREQQSLLIFEIPELPKMTSLCAYLKSKQDSVLKIPPLKDSIKTLETWLTVHLGDLKDSEKKPEFMAKMSFLKLLKMGDKADDDEVLKFFEKITGQKFPHEKKKLFSLYSERKAKLAYLFGLPNGINDYIEILRGISDGCIANIGTKTNIYLLGKLFKSETDQVVFPFFINKIFTPYANQGDDILGSRVEGTNVFQTPAILSLYLSPPALIQGLADELADDPKKSATIIQSLTNKDEFDSFQDNIFCFEDQAEAEGVQARLASYLIVREIMKDELKNDHFRSATETLTPLLSEDFSLDSYRELQNRENARELPTGTLSMRG